MDALKANASHAKTIVAKDNAKKSIETSTASIKAAKKGVDEKYAKMIADIKINAKHHINLILQSSNGFVEEDEQATTGQQLMHNDDDDDDYDDDV